MIVICFALTYDLSRYYIVTNTPEQLDDMSETLVFTQFIGFGSYTAIETMFSLAGFTQAISFLQGSNSKPTFWNVIHYTVRRVLKIEVFYAINLMFLVYYFRELGSGPTWHFFNKLLKPCDENLWPNLLFINNFTNNFGRREDMCMPWTWFISVYIQLSLITPFIVYCLSKNLMVFYPFVILISIVCGGTTAIQIWVNQSGIFPSYD